MIGNLKIFSLLKTRMQWHQSNQVVIAENIAHANTPGYKARAMTEPDFKAILQRERENGFSASTLKRTNGMHMQVSGEQADAGQAEEASHWEVTPSGNSVVLEEEMMKLAENQLNYQTVTSLYAKSLRLMKIAVGK
ncbi:MAG: flagellar basal body rod protein FlgB [OCS116 cluster bacterium]|uniref:Flagellar basal body rod protein FlgB n=1 Tax=OCS116 cluster bacterium TaxID=2030921 RepID=A0A2A4Z1A0_9PROT|nr:flagellar basal body rod protein FlgB [OCS116 cluster bacterium]